MTKIMSCPQYDSDFSNTFMETEDQKSAGSATKNKAVPAKALTAEENVAKWKKEAEAGNAEAQLKLGNAYGEGKGVTKDATQAVTWWRKAAEQGNAAAQREGVRIFV